MTASRTAVAGAGAADAGMGDPSRAPPYHAPSAAPIKTKPVEAPPRRAFRGRLARALRRRLLVTSVRDVADVVGCSIQAVYLWRAEEREPSAYAYSRLCLLFGPEFEAEVGGVTPLRR